MAKPYLTEDQLSELMGVRGLKYRLDEFHTALVGQCLDEVQLPDAIFRQKVESILREFLVNGRTMPDPKTAPPTQRLRFD